MSFSLPRPTMKKWSLVRVGQDKAYRVFQVDRHELTDPHGHRRDDIYTFVCPDWCNVVAVTDDDEVVFVWQHRFGTDALSLEIPGGMIDPGESPEEACRRELLEETGFEAREWSHLVSLEANPALQNNRVHTYVARGARKIREPAFDESEDLELVLVQATDIARLLDEGVVAHALVVSALEVFLRRGTKGARGERAGT